MASIFVAYHTQWKDGKMGFGHCVLEKFPITSISNAEDFRVLQKALQETLTTDTDIPSVVIINWKFLNDRE